MVKHPENRYERRRLKDLYEKSKREERASKVRRRLYRETLEIQGTENELQEVGSGNLLG